MSARAVTQSNPQIFKGVSVWQRAFVQKRKGKNMARINNDNLIAITVNQPGFEYDIHSLAKAFYPACNVRVFLEGEEKEGSGENLPELSVHFTEEAITISIVKGENSTASFGGRKADRKSVV